MFKSNVLLFIFHTAYCMKNELLWRNGLGEEVPLQERVCSGSVTKRSQVMRGQYLILVRE